LDWSGASDRARLIEKFAKNKGLEDQQIESCVWETPTEIFENWKLSLQIVVLIVRRSIHERLTGRHLPFARRAAFAYLRQPVGPGSKT